MPSLRELQSTFSNAVFGDSHQAEQLVAWCAGQHADRGLQAYRNSVLANLAGAVRSTYPVIERIVGTSFLNAAIRQYVLARPSRCSDLNAYGDDFGDFLEHLEPAAELPYLPDIARIEWWVQCIHDAANGPEQDLSALATATPEQWAELRFRVDPAHAVFRSRWPVARIWEVNQASYDGDFTVDFEQAETVLIQRQGHVVAVEALTESEAAFLQSLVQGNTLTEAANQVIGHEGFDLQSTLQRFIPNGLIRQAYLTETHGHAN